MLIGPYVNGAAVIAGGLLMVATGLRISNIKTFPVANMLPALVLVMPLSWLWAHFVA